MPKIFRGAFWTSVTIFLTKISEKLNKHPRGVRLAVLIALNLVSFFFFWVISYGLFLHLVPEPGHPDYGLMRFGAHFTALITSLLLSLGLFHLVRGIVMAGKFVSDKISDVSKGLRDGGTVVIEVPKKAVDAIKHASEKTGNLLKNTSVTVANATKEGLQKGSEFVKANAPVVGYAVRDAAQKTGHALKDSSEKAVDWSKKNIPPVALSVGMYLSALLKKITGLFKKHE